MAARDAIACWEPLGGREECDTLCLLAISYSELGLHEEALKAATAAFDKARAQKFDAQMVQALNRIGVCFDRLGDPSQSEKFLLQSLGQARELGDPDQVLGALNNLMATTISAFYHFRQRDEPDLAQAALQRARQYGRQSVSLGRRLADTYRLTVTQGNLGEVLGLAGAFEESHRVLDDTVKQAQRHGYRAVELRSRHNIGEVLIQQGRLHEAIELLKAALADLENSDQETTRLRVHSALYRAYKAAGDFEPALAHCEAYHALELQRAKLQSHAQARLMVNRIDVENALMDGERARLEAELQRLRSRELESEKRELEARTAELQRDTLEDQLTRLANRRRVDADLPRIFSRAPSRPRRCASRWSTSTTSRPSTTASATASATTCCARSRRSSASRHAPATWWHAWAARSFCSSSSTPRRRWRRRSAIACARRSRRIRGSRRQKGWR